MVEYIEREAAIEAMYKDAEAHPDHTFWATQYEALRNIPAADVIPRDEAIKAYLKGVEYGMTRTGTAGTMRRRKTDV